MAIFLVGDIHREFVQSFNKLALKLNEKYANCTIIQLGDFGMYDNEIDRNRKLHPSVKFIRGNHDCPEVCQLKPNYLGDYGVIEIEGIKIFFVSGADSVNKNARVMGKNWWPNEQLSYQEFNNVLDLYQQTCAVSPPDVVISHDAPARVCEAIIGNKFIGGYSYIPNRTTRALDFLFNIHHPKQWFFGHHHLKFQREIGGTQFRCLDIFEVMRLN